MVRVRKLTLSSLLVVVVLLTGAAPALASTSNVCPVTGGPDNATNDEFFAPKEGLIKSTPAEVPDKSGNPAHGGEDPSNAQPGDAFWN